MKRDPWYPGHLTFAGQVVGGLLVFALVAILDWSSRPKRRS